MMDPTLKTTTTRLKGGSGGDSGGSSGGQRLLPLLSQEQQRGAPPPTSYYDSSSSKNNNTKNKTSNNTNHNNMNTKTNTTNANNTSGGCLRLTILSAYDLPDREPPLYVRLEIGSQSVRTGPPVQRHKDRNSFKFHSQHKKQQQQQQQPASSSAELLIRTPTLAELYQESAILTVVYLNPNKPQYVASYPLHQLLIHETTWLILNLTQPLPLSSTTTPASATTTATATNHATTTTTATTTATAASSTTTKTNKNTLDPLADPLLATTTATATATTGLPVPTTVRHRLLGSNGGQSSIASCDDTDDEDVPPTLRLQMTLDGPYRTDVAAFLALIRAWLAFVDDMEEKFQRHVWPRIPNVGVVVPLSWLLVPLAPIIAFVVVTTPIWMGLALVTLPLVLPAVVLAFCFGAMTIATALILYASTQQGRQQVAQLLHPMHHALMHTQTGQAWIFQTGPRPTPVHLCRTFLFPSGIWGKLILSLWIDFMGSATYLLPVLGEVVDVVWAPLQTTFIMALYCPPQNNNNNNENTGDDPAPFGSAILPYLSFMEEILPLTDIVPTATLGWLGEFAIPLIQQQLFPTTNNNNNNGTTKNHRNVPSGGGGGGDSLRVVLSNLKQHL